MCNVCEFIGGDFKEWGQFMKEDEDEERSMKKTDNVVFLSAPTGTGKTTFILHSFSDFVVREKKGRILILVPRIILQSQMENILKKFFIGIKRWKMRFGVGRRLESFMLSFVTKHIILCRTSFSIQMHRRHSTGFAILFPTNRDWLSARVRHLTFFRRHLLKNLN